MKTSHVGRTLVVTSKRALLVGTLVCFLFLTFLSAAYADIPVVTPAEGTIGTTFTITGLDFGTKKGRVFVGSKRCQVIKWSDTSIEALIKAPMEPGTYDLIVNPRGRAPDVTLWNAFTIMEPALEQPGLRPHFVTSGEVVSWGGAFLGAGKGPKKVEVEDLNGKTKPCTLLEATMDSITFKLPSGIPGEVNLRYTNGVGTAVCPFWGTFAAPPENPPTLMQSYSGYESYDNAAAVSYRNRLWVFYNHRDSDDYKIAYRTWDGSVWTPGVYVTANGQDQKSQAQVTPVVVKDVLYLFITGLGGHLDYVIYNPHATDETQRWQGFYRVPGGILNDVTGRFAAVYNFTKNQIEVYWTPDKSVIYMKTYSLDTGDWSAAKTVNIPGPAGTIPSYLTAVFNQLDGGDYVTYLSWSNSAVGGYLGELKDGVVLRYTALWYWQPKNPNRGPSLADLGEKYLAVITNNTGYQSHYQKYDKTQHTVVGGTDQLQSLIAVPFTSPDETSWAPNGVVFSKRYDDTDQMDTSFYVLVGHNPTHDPTHWQFVECEYLGYWLPTGNVEYVDFLGNDLPSAPERKQRIADTFSSWPIIGLVDMPPFVLNGHDLCEDCQSCSCTTVDFSFVKATTTGFGGSYSVGAYVETGRKSPVTLDVSAGFTGGFENETTFTYTQTTSLEANLEGKVLAFYLVPSFYVHELEWHDFSGAATGIKTKSMEIDTATIVTQQFEPETGPTDLDPHLIPPYLDPAAFPVHAAAKDKDRERLDTYDNLLPTHYETVVEPESSWWSPGNPPDFGWEITQTNTVDKGFYLKMKMGVEIAKRIGFGVEGELEMHVTTKTEVGVGVTTYFKNPGPENPSDPLRVDQFEVLGYWLKPNASGYWVPQNRKGMGDTPWFITYRVPVAYP